MSSESNLTFKATEHKWILMDTQICEVKELHCMCLRLCVFTSQSSLFFALMFVFCVTHTRTQHQQNTRTQVLDVALHRWLVSRVTSHHRVRKQTAHNLIGNCTTWQHSMTCPVTLETSIHPSRLAAHKPSSQERCEWWQRCFYMLQ